jgi:predicted membrane protein
MCTKEGQPEDDKERDAAIKLPFTFLALIAVLAISALFYRAFMATPQHDISYDNYLVITLTALAVMLAILAIAISLAAIWGYQQIKVEAAQQADKAVASRVTELLDNLDLRGMIKAELNFRVAQEADTLYQDVTATIPEAERDTRPIADKYPKEEGEK